MVHPGFIKSNASKSEATIETTEAHQMIGKFLIAFCVTFVDMIRKMLKKSFLRGSVCRKVTEGASCDNSSCEYQHCEDSDELFNSRFHSLFNSVYLESVVEQGVLEMTENRNESDISLLFFKDFREFDACHRFYSLLFPSSGYRTYQTKTSHLRSIMMTKAVKRRLFHFAEFLWRKTSGEKRRGNTDNFLKVSSSLQLIRSSSILVRWISAEEVQFQKLTRSSFKPTKDHLTKNGMVVKKDSDLYESYLHWWETGKKMLYVYGDVVNAAHEVVRRFLTFTAMRKGTIHPSIANAVMILELQLTACLALYAKICTEHRYPICLPESYLIMVRVWDSVFANDDKGTFTLYEAVEHASQERNRLRLLKSTCSVLNYMVKLACGDVAHLFNVLGDALSSDDTPAHNASGDLERSLVLFFTMLCNCGKGISTSVEHIMLKNIFSLKPKSCLPNRINKVLVEVQEAKGCCDVIAVFDKFLQTRSERLYDLRWHNRKLRFDGPANPTNYRKRFHNDTSIIREELRKIQKETVHHGEAVSKDEVISEGVDFDASEESIGVEYTADLLKEKENARSEVELEVAATEIQRWYRRAEEAKVFRARKLERLKSIEEQINASTTTAEARFSKFKLDSSACGICGVHFASLDDNQEEYDGKTPIIFISSCTTVSISPSVFHLSVNLSKPSCSIISAILYTTLTVSRAIMGLLFPYGSCQNSFIHFSFHSLSFGLYTN